jgi:amidohydrolase
MPKGKDKSQTAPHHTPEFYLDDSSFRTGVVALSNLVLDYIAMKRRP